MHTHIVGMPHRKRRPRARAPRKYLLSPSKAASYALQAAALVLLASVDRFGGALALGLFAGLCYARQNLAVIAPVYALAVIAFEPSPWTLLYVAVPVLLYVAVYVGFYRARKNVHILVTTAAAVAGELPHAVTNALFGGGIAESALCAVIAGVFAFCAQTVCYAVLLRGIKTRFTPDEKIAGGICVMAFAYAAAAVRADGFVLLFALVPFFSMLFAYGVSPLAALSFSVLAGAGGALAFLSPDTVALTVGIAAAVCALMPFTKWASAAGAVAVYVVLWLGAGAAGTEWQGAVCVALGAGAFVLLPGRFVTGMFGGRRGTAAVNSIVNRDRGEMASRLYSVSRVFGDMSENLRGAESAEHLYTPERLAGEIAKNYCGRCAEREGCFSALGGDTSSVLLPMANAALSRGKTTILDMPPFVTGRCVKMHNLAAVVNSAAEVYRRRAEEAGGGNDVRRLMSEQFAGVSLVLDSLASECGEKVSFGEELQDVIGNELLRHNIVAGEIVARGEGAGMSVALTVRASDADKLVLPRIVSACVGTELEKVAAVPRGDDCVVHLSARSVFEVAYGCAERSRKGEKVSGDTKSVLCPSRRRRLFALSDGMGSGERAAGYSRSAISMVENFYRAGFDNAVILTLVNKLLCLGTEEGFSSLDIAVADTVSGGLDMIKMGAAPTFIVRRGGIECVSCEALPAGILERARPFTGRQQLYDGDMVIMMSDGVFDVLDEQGIADVVEQSATSNPQVLADRILERAVAGDAQDDCTVLVLRLFAL